MSKGERQDDVFGQLAPLRRYARALTRDEAGADNLVHDALVRAYERRATFRAGGSLRAWLLSILHNTFLDARRRRAADLRRDAQAAQLTEPAVPAGQESSVRLQQLRRAFMALPEEQRAALHLVTIEGLAYQQAADTLAIPIGTLMSRLGRARAALRAFEASGGPAQPAALPSPKTSRPTLRIVGGYDD